jgi:hypothetical protein
MTAPVTLLLRSVQRRLWLEALCERERRALWVSAAVVLGGATWHLALGAHSGSATAAAALAVLAGPLGAALLSGRPPAAEAARRADAWFDGNELMTSAQDQLARRPAERAGAADFVVARAVEAAALWQTRLVTRPLRLGLRRLSAPLALVVVGGFLHLLPGRLPAAVPAGPGRDAAAGGAAPVAPAGDALAWRRPADPATAPRAGSPAASGGDTDAPTGDGVAPPALAHGRSSGPGAGNLPGASAPRDGVLHPGSDEPLGTSFVDLPRPEGRDAVGSRPVELGGEIPGSPGGSPAAAPGAQRVEGEAAPDLPPVLRAYVAAYLRRLGDVR